MALRKIVVDQAIVAGGQQMSERMAADISGTADDEDFHVSIASRKAGGGCAGGLYRQGEAPAEPAFAGRLGRSLALPIGCARFEAQVNILRRCRGRQSGKTG